MSSFLILIANSGLSRALTHTLTRRRIKYKARLLVLYNCKLIKKSPNWTDTHTLTHVQVDVSQGSTDSQVRHDGEDVNEPPSDSINFLWTVADVDRNTREFLHIKERAETFGMNENFKCYHLFSHLFLFHGEWFKNTLFWLVSKIFLIQCGFNITSCYTFHNSTRKT